MDGALTVTTYPGQSGPGSNGNEEIINTPRSLELEPHNQMQFNETPFLKEYILSHSHRCQVFKSIQKVVCASDAKDRTLGLFLLFCLICCCCCCCCCYCCCCRCCFIHFRFYQTIGIQIAYLLRKKLRLTICILFLYLVNELLYCSNVRPIPTSFWPSVTEFATSPSSFYLSLFLIYIFWFTCSIFNLSLKGDIFPNQRLHNFMISRAILQLKRISLGIITKLFSNETVT